MLILNRSHRWSTSTEVHSASLPRETRPSCGIGGVSADTDYIANPESENIANRRRLVRPGKPSASGNSIVLLVAR